MRDTSDRNEGHHVGEEAIVNLFSLLIGQAIWVEVLRHFFQLRQLGLEPVTVRFLHGEDEPQ